MLSFSDAKSHILSRLHEIEPGSTPYRHLYIEEIFPSALYKALKDRAVQYHRSDGLQPRVQDNKAFVNAKYSLKRDQSPDVSLVRDIFSDREVKEAFLERFYLRDIPDLAESLRIHDEFQFTFTAANRFQNIHVDIPPKYLSFVFYLPDEPLDDEAQGRNATILYDKKLAPKFHAKYKSNSVCVFAPHFYTYHGFSTTIERPALVLFYVNEQELKAWDRNQKAGADAPPFEAYKDATQEKLLRHPLREYGDQLERLTAERDHCLVNAPLGRVMRPEDGDPGRAAYIQNIKNRAKHLVSEGVVHSLSRKHARGPLPRD